MQTIFDIMASATSEERKCCVYMWSFRDENGNRHPFYVGSGRKNRPYEMNKRSPALLKYIAGRPYEITVLALNQHPAVAREMEYYIKKTLRESGFTLLDGEDDMAYRRTRQAEGIAIAKAAGKYTGRKPIAIDKAKFEAAYGRVQRGECTNKYAQKVLGLKPSTYYKAVNDYNNHTGPWEA